MSLPEDSSQTMIRAESRRLADIDRAKGIAIILVVLGHVVARQPPQGNVWFDVLKGVIYKFHMPFFMFLSGLIAAYTYKPLGSVREFAEHVRRRATRLLPAYFLFAVVVFVAKWAAQPFMAVDNPVADPVDFACLVLSPMQGHSAFLWYVWVLFILCCLAPVLLELSRGRLAPVLAFAFLLQFAPATRLLGIDLVCEYLFVFLLGFAALRRYSLYTGLLDAHVLLAVLPFCGALVALMMGIDLPKWCVGLLSIPALHALVRTRFVEDHPRALDILGRGTFPIYLMNTLAIGLMKGSILMIVPWDGPMFFVVAPALFLSGLLVPLLVKRHLLPRVTWLDRITS